MQHDTPLDPDARAAYEAPAVIEDLPLESFSLACGKADNACEDQGGALSS
ncbi:MAG: hypothetical protein R3A52_15170 [Polyangiales bacterium]